MSLLGGRRRATPLDDAAAVSSATVGMAEPWGGAPHLPFLGRCANPACSTGWLQIWRSRSTPVFEGGWSCSPECTAELLQRAVTRELEGRSAAAQTHRHRVPIGLLMVEHGWISAAQLRSALEAQRAAKAGQLGYWLMVKEGVSEHLVTRALGLQWSCPVLSLDTHDPERLSSLLPRLFVDAYSALPLRVAAGRLVYLGFETRLDPGLAFAMERMSGLQVESGLVRASQFRPAHRRMLESVFPRVELLETASEPVLVRVLTKAVERLRPVESRLVRLHDCLWLRLWRKLPAGCVADPEFVHDMICTIAG